jgi:FMN-dependent NADH-azoreductase
VPTLLHIACSPRPQWESAAGARVFLDRFDETRPGWGIDTMDLWPEPLPEFNGALLEAKYARMAGQALTEAQHEAFAAAERSALRLARAERVLVSTPMWNFGVPYR